MNKQEFKEKVEYELKAYSEMDGQYSDGACAALRHVLNLLKEMN